MIVTTTKRIWSDLWNYKHYEHYEKRFTQNECWCQIKVWNKIYNMDFESFELKIAVPELSLENCLNLCYNSHMWCNTADASKSESWFSTAAPVSGFGAGNIGHCIYRIFLFTHRELVHNMFGVMVIIFLSWNSLRLQNRSSYLSLNHNPDIPAVRNQWKTWA